MYETYVHNLNQKLSFKLKYLYIRVLFYCTIYNSNSFCKYHDLDSWTLRAT